MRADAALEVKETETSAEIRITDPAQLQAFIEQESRMLKDMVKKVVDSACSVVFCQKGIDDLAQHYLATHGIMAARRVKKSDMEKLAKATGGKIVSIPNGDVESIETSPVSLMPQGLTARLRRDELIDLMRYLTSRGKKDEQAK